jgi:hypothetical protein
MEMNQTELALVEKAVDHDQPSVVLADLQLAYAAGGIGDVVMA